jgi:hypothetical protein
MFNPFAPFEPRFLSAFKQKGVKAFVKQTYPRGRNLLENNSQPSFLLIHFTDIVKAVAHFEKIGADPDRQLFNLAEPQHCQQLIQLFSKPCGHHYYTNLLIKDVNVVAKKILDKKIRSYISTYTEWYPRRGEQVNFSLDIIFGEIYVRLAYGFRQARLKLDELDNPFQHVL